MCAVTAFVLSRLRTGRLSALVASVFIDRDLNVVVSLTVVRNARRELYLVFGGELTTIAVMLVRCSRCEQAQQTEKD